MAVRLGSRGSALAIAQATLIRDRLEAGGEQVEIVTVRTSGDESAAGEAAPETEDKARFVKELEEALLRDEIDLAVHSAKDVPGELPEGLAIVGVPERADPRDSLCGAASLAQLPEGALVGTASLRRRSQLLATRPDLMVAELRGNVDTRLARLAEGELTAVVLAAAGLARLGRAEAGTPLPEAAMTPAPGQGCLLIEARAEDSRAATLGAALTQPDALTTLTAERALARALGATCHTPVGAYAWLDRGRLAIDGYAGDPDGDAWVRDHLTGDPREPGDLGRAIAERMLAAGAAAVLDGSAADRGAI